MSKTDSPYRVRSANDRYGASPAGLIFIGVIVILAINLLATEMIAARFHFANALGAPLMHLGSVSIYQPFAWLVWNLRYASTEIVWVRNANLMGAVLALLGSQRDGWQ